MDQGSNTKLEVEKMYLVGEEIEKGEKTEVRD